VLFHPSSYSFILLSVNLNHQQTYTILAYTLFTSFILLRYDFNNLGEKARRQYVANPKNTFSSVKRIIGRSIAELAKSGEKLSTHKIDKKYLNKKMSADEIGMNCPNLERNTTPLEISSEILKHLVAEASAYLGGEIITYHNTSHMTMPWHNIDVKHYMTQHSTTQHNMTTNSISHCSSQD
jgi:Hsp70 protein